MPNSMADGVFFGVDGCRIAGTEGLYTDNLQVLYKDVLKRTKVKS